MAGTSQLATPVAARICLPHGGSSTCARKGSKARLDARGRGVFAFGARGRRPPFWSGFWRLAIRLSATLAAPAVSSRLDGRLAVPWRRRVGVMTVMVVVAHLQELPAAGRRRARSESQASLMRAAGAAGSSPRAVVFGSLAHCRPQGPRPPVARLSHRRWCSLVTGVHVCSFVFNFRERSKFVNIDQGK